MNISEVERKLETKSGNGTECYCMRKKEGKESVSEKGCGMRQALLISLESEM